MSVGSRFLIVCSRWLFLETVFLARFQAHSTAGRKAEISPALPSPCTHLPPPIRPAAGGPCVTADELHCYVAVTQGPRLTTGSLTPGLAPSESGRVAGAWPARRRHAAPPPPPLIPAPRDTDPSMPHGSVLSTASVRSACAAFSSGLRPRSERLFLKAWLAVRGTCESALFS